MTDQLAVNLYNFTGVAIDNITFLGKISADQNIAGLPFSLPPNAPGDPDLITMQDSRYIGYYLRLKYNVSDGINYVLMPFPTASGTFTVYFVNDNGIDYPSLVGNNGDITPYLYSNGYQKSNALITNGTQYALATSYDFGKAYVIAVPANPTIARLPKVDSIVWSGDGTKKSGNAGLDGIVTDKLTDLGKEKGKEKAKDLTAEESSYWWILLLVLAIVAVIIMVVIGIAYKMRADHPSVATALASQVDPMVTWQEAR